jgi:hypothetical protein
MVSESLPVLYGRSSYFDGVGDDSWSLAYVGGATPGQVLFTSLDGEAVVSPPTRRIFHLPSDVVVVPGTNGLVVGTQTTAARGTVNVRWLADGTTYTDDMGLTTLGGRAIDEDLAVAPLPAETEGAWLALWRSSNADTSPMGMATSPGSSLPTALSRVQESLMGVWEVQDVSLGRAGPELSDGWIVTYIAITDTTHRLHVFHLTF